MVRSKQEMNYQKQLSVILPLHNVEGYVAKAAESIRSQAFDGLEVVVVDDGSSDNSLEACLDGLRALDVVAVSQENTGPGGARNAGLLAASGLYVMFVDGDDFLLPGAFESILQVLESERPDVLFGRYLRWTPETGFLEVRKYRFDPPKDPEKRTEYILGALPEPSWNVWRYICRRELIIEHGILFESSMYCEDVKWIMELLSAAERTSGRISFLPKPFYAYNYRRPNSIMNSYTIKRIVDLNTIVEELLDKYQDRPAICRILIWQSFFYINEYCAFGKDERERIFQSYRVVLPRYVLSNSVIHRIAGKMDNPALFYTLSLSLAAVKNMRRAFLNLKSRAKQQR